MEGWIKLHRKFLTWEWYDKSEMVHLFIHLLISANHEDGKWRGVEVKRGQVITGINSLSNDTGLSKQSIRTCLKNLQKTGEINKQSNNRFTLITICNYDSYNKNDNTPNKPHNKRVTSKQQATNNPTNNKQEYKNEKNEKNKEVKFIPPTLSEVKQYCEDRKNNLDPSHWIDFYESKGWMIGKNKMKDWKAAIRTWEGRCELEKKVNGQKFETNASKIYKHFNAR